MKRLRTGDKVLVITGKDKNKSGKILSFVKNDSDYAIVENINIQRRHYPSSPTRDAGIKNINTKIHVSNLMLILNDKPTKVKIEVKDKKRVRVPRKS